MLGDSDVRADRVAFEPDQAGRPEVEAGLNGDVYIETVPTNGQPVIYGTRRITLAGAPVVLRIAAPVTAIDAAVARIAATSRIETSNIASIASTKVNAVGR